VIGLLALKENQVRAGKDGSWSRERFHQELMTVQMTEEKRMIEEIWIHVFRFIEF
jgi:hypothetical protein